MSLSGMQQICVHSEAVPPAEMNKGNFDGVQRSSDCECSEMLGNFFPLPLSDVETLVCNYVQFVTLLPHVMRQK